VGEGRRRRRRRRSCQSPSRPRVSFFLNSNSGNKNFQK
jgi:hypothetical protein